MIPDLEKLTCGCQLRHNFVVCACERHYPVQIGMEWMPKENHCPDCGVVHRDFPQAAYICEQAKPNRFAPFEALDRITSLVEGVLGGLVEGEEDGGDLIRVLRRVDALRAYVTGMER